MDDSEARIGALETKVNYLLGAFHGAHIIITGILTELMNADTINRDRLRELLDGLAVSLEAERGGFDSEKLAQHDAKLNVVRRFVTMIEESR
jgi:hypothetical protein